MQSLRRLLATPPPRPWPDRPVSIALTITDLDVGGAERALVALATGLDRERWAPSVVCLALPGALVAALEAADVPVTCLAVDRRRPAQAVRRLARALRRIRPALVQSFLFHANVATKLAAPFAGRPWVVCGMRVAERRNRWHLALEQLTQGLAAGAVCVSEGVRRHAVEQGGLDPDRLIVIPNGIDLDRFDARCAASAQPELPPRTILFVGRIEPQKGVAYLLEAFAAIAEDRPDWSLAMVGEGPDLAAHRSRCEVDRHLHGRVRWLGRRDDVPALLRGSDLVVLPSLWEGMPNVILEAMAAARPVVATRVEGTEDLVNGEGPDRTGWLVEPADAGALAKALREATARPENLPQIGESGRRRVERDFTQARVISAYERLWSGVLGLDLAASRNGVKTGGGSGR